MRALEGKTSTRDLPLSTLEHSSYASVGSNSTCRGKSGRRGTEEPVISDAVHIAPGNRRYTVTATVPPAMHVAYVALMRELTYQRT